MTDKTEAATVRTDAYCETYDAWMEFAKKHPNMPPELAEQCPIECSPEDFARQLERELGEQDRYIGCVWCGANVYEYKGPLKVADEDAKRIVEAAQQHDETCQKNPLAAKLASERAARAAAERDVTRLNYLETHFHIDGTADEPVYSTFVPILKSGAQTLREAIDQALTTPGSHNGVS